MRLIRILAVLAALLAAAAIVWALTTPEQSPSSYEVGAEFEDFYREHGGKRMFGLPLTETIDEGGRLVQYFDNVCMAYIPENPPGWRVQLVPLGVLVGRTPDPPVAQPASDPLIIYYPATGHTVTEPFLSEYQGYGGSEVFGNPLSEAVQESGRQLQYFEYVVFYWAADARPGQRVQLAPLGRMALEREPSWWQEQERIYPAGRVDGAFYDFFETYGGEVVFGAPLEGAHTDASGRTVQTFENVRMELHTGGTQPLVQLTPLGAWLGVPAGAIEAAPGPGDRCFDATGYCLADAFAQFYDSCGGAAVLGVARSPLLHLPDGSTVQHLDNARLEWDIVANTPRLSPLGQWWLEGTITPP
jgi:hypothetical protein